MITIGFCDIADDRLTFSLTDELTIEEAISYKFLDKIKAIEEAMIDSNLQEDDRERAILVGSDTEESLQELHELALACEVSVVNQVFRKELVRSSILYR